MFSLNKLIWLIAILLAVWYLFKFFEKKNKHLKNNSQSKKNQNNLDAVECSKCGLWTTGKGCENKDCEFNL